MARIDRAVDRRRKHDLSAFLQSDEGIAPGRHVGTETGAGDRDQPPTGSKARERGGDMPEGGVLNFAGDIRHRGKRWVHQDDRWHDPGIEVVVNLRRIEAGDGKSREEGGEEVGAGVGQFVEDQTAAGDFGEDRHRGQCQPKAQAPHHRA